MCPAHGPHTPQGNYACDGPTQNHKHTYTIMTLFLLFLWQPDCMILDCELCMWQCQILDISAGKNSLSFPTSRGGLQSLASGFPPQYSKSAKTGCVLMSQSSDLFCLHLSLFKASCDCSDHPSNPQASPCFEVRWLVHLKYTCNPHAFLSWKATN